MPDTSETNQDSKEGEVQKMESIPSRLTKLNCIVCKKEQSIPNCHLASRDGLLDALFALYDECDHDYMKKSDANISLFVNKFRNTVAELKKLCVNKSDFEVKKIIGRGHFGEVQVVKEKQSGTIYAMKVLEKRVMLSKKCVAFYEEERDIMAKANSPWLTQLQYAFQDNRNLYLVMEFHPGGDMLSLLQRFDNVFPEDMARFYLAELVLAINSLHSMGYVHRDIKPDNILLDSTGHIKLADFGSAAVLNSKNMITSEMPVGTPEYIAPEVLKSMEHNSTSKGYGVECDWWSHGIVTYEMLYGETPFYDDTVVVIYNNIMKFKDKLEFPSDVEVSEAAISLICGLLEYAPKRLKYEDLLNHPFFEGINWENLRQEAPPFIPVITGDDDTSNFDEFGHEGRRIDVDSAKTKFSGKNLPFIGFTYTAAAAPQYLDGSSTLNSSILLSPPLHNNHNNNKKEEEMRQQVKRLEETVASLNEKLSIVQSHYKEKIDACTSLTEEKKGLGTALIKAKHEFENLKKLLQLEREQNRELEQNTKQILCDLKKKYKKKEEQLLTELDSKNEVISRLQASEKCLQDKLDGKSKELRVESVDREKMEQQIKECRLLLMKEVESCRDRIAKNKEEHSQKIEALKKEHSTAMLEKEKQHQLDIENMKKEYATILLEKEGLHEQIISLKEKNKNYRSVIKSTQQDVLKLKEIHGLLVQTFSTSVTAFKKDMDDVHNTVWSIQEKCAGCVQNLTSELAEMTEIKKKLDDDLVNVLQEERKQKEDIKVLKEKITEQEEHITMLQAENAILKNRSQEENPTVVTAVDTPTEEKDVFEGGEPRSSSTVTLVTSDQLDEKDLQLERMEKREQRVRERLLKERTVNRELEEKVAKQEHELAILKYDISKFRTEAEQAKDTVKQLTESNRELRQRSHGLSEDLEEMKKAHESLKQQITLLENHNNNLKMQLVERTRDLEGLRDASKQLERCKAMYEETRNYNESLKCEAHDAKQKVASLEQQIGRLESSLEEKCHEYNTIELRYNGLKSVAEVMDRQLEDYSSLVHNLRDEKAELEKRNESLEQEVKELEGKVRNLINTLSQEKKNVVEVHEKLDELNEQLTSRAAKLEELLEEQREANEDLVKQKEEIELLLAEKDSLISSQKEQLSTLQDDNYALKEESANHLTKFLSVKQSNVKLSRALADALDEITDRKKELEQMQNIMEGMQQSHEEQKIRMQQTVAQQAKLINFLQTKMEGHDKKKTTMQKLFGSKHKDSSNVGSDVASHIKDLEEQLAKEKSKCRRLHQKLQRGYAEIMELQQKQGKQGSFNAADKRGGSSKAVTFAPSLDSDSLDECSSCESVGRADSHSVPQRMSHNIPHRFQETLCMRATKCAACLNSILFGRHANKCSECNIFCHVKCSNSMPRNCGLPSGYMEHFSNVMMGEDCIDSADVPCNDAVDSSSTNDTVILEGWVKVPRPRKPSWDRLFARIQGTTLALFPKECPRGTSLSAACITVELQRSPGTEVIVSSAIHSTELVNHASNINLPYIFKVETKKAQSTQPTKCVYMMTTTFEEKKMWVAALESTVNASSGEGTLVDPRLMSSRVLRMEGNIKLDINCIHVLTENVLLLGANEALFVVVDPWSQNKIHKIVGAACVNQIEAVESAGLLVLLEKRTLSTTMLTPSVHDWAASVATSSPPPEGFRLSLYPVDFIEDQCHLFSVYERQGGRASSEKTEVFLFAAAETEIFLLSWSVRERRFLLNKRCSTVQPCSCVQFSTNMVVFGADKFYELDLKYFTVEDFLDPTDQNLSFFVYAAEPNNVLPIAVIPVFLDENGEEEYLLCFNNVGVFVDNTGHCSRGTMKWTRLPLSIVYNDPYLFVVHNDLVEMVDLSSSDKPERYTRSTLKLAAPCYLGHSNKGFRKGIFLASVQEDTTEVYLVRGPLPSAGVTYTAAVPSTSQGPETDAELEDSLFSFTNSVMQQLDSSSE